MGKMADYYDADPLDWNSVLQQAFRRHSATRHVARSRDGEVLDPGPFTIPEPPTLTKGNMTTMPSLNQPILGSLDHLKQQQARLDARIAEIEARLNQYGEDVYSPGALLVWDKQFTAGGITYSYAALKTPIGWFITGRDSSTALSWTGLIDHITKDAVALPILYSVTEMEEVMP